MTPDGSDLIGRERELAELRSAHDGARRGQGALVVVTGEAGIGKTRLLEAFADEARDGGALVLWGACWDGGGAPAFWPWVQVLRELAAHASPEELRDDAGAAAGYLLPIAPDLRARLGDVAPPAPLDAAQARFGAFDAVTTLLRNSAERRPLAVVLDDLHAADRPSLLLLDFLSRALRDAALLVACAYREAEAPRDGEGADLLAGLARSGRRLALRGLSPAEVAELVARQAGGPAPEEVVARVHALTEGNPFFADELARLLAGGHAASARPLALPDTVRETVRRRLDPLSGDAHGTLAVAAVIGKEFDADTLAAAAGLPGPQALEHLDEAVAAGLLAESPAVGGRFAFTHAIVRETLYEMLPRGRRQDAHGRVARALEARGGIAARLSEIAHHFSLAPGAEDVGKALEYAQRAGEQAARALAYEEAEAQLEAALGAVDRGAGDALRRCELLLALGDARMRAGKASLARRTLEDAAALAAELGEAELLARCALAAAGPWGLSLNVADEGLVRLLEQAGAALPSGGGVLSARVLAALAVALYWSAPLERRLELATEAIAAAREAGDPAALARVLGDAHVATWDPDSLGRGLPWAEEILGIADRLGDAELALHAHAWRTSLLLEQGDAVAVDEAVATFGRLADELRQPRARASAMRYRALRALVQGRLDEVERVVADQGRHGAAHPPGSVDFMLLAGQTFGLRWIQGRLGELVDVVRGIVDESPAMPVWRCALVAAQRDAGRTDEMGLGYARMAADGFAGLPRDNLWLVGMTFLAEACADLADGEGAGHIARLLAPYAGRLAVAPGAAAFGPVDRALALAEIARGDPAAALAHLAAGREVAGRLMAVPSVGLIALAEGRAHALAGDGAAAAAALEEAARVTEVVGMPGHAARVAALRAELGIAPGAPSRPHSPVAAPPAGAARELACRGDFWSVSTAERSFLVKDLKGLHHLARLIARPGDEVHALDLAGGGDGSPEARVLAAGLTVRAGGEDAGPMLDPQAKAAYRTRLEELREAVEEAERFNDPERAARAREEIEFIGRELSAAVGLGGRDRRAASSAERARLNVTRAIRAAIDHIGQQDEMLADELRAAVRTGTFCAYRPRAGAPGWLVAG